MVHDHGNGFVDLMGLASLAGNAADWQSVRLEKCTVSRRSSFDYVNPHVTQDRG
jgi:hypothetical protein